MSGYASGNEVIEPTHRPPSPSPGEKHWEIWVVGILALTALATAWSGYSDVYTLTTLLFAAVLFGAANHRWLTAAQLHIHLQVS